MNKMNKLTMNVEYLVTLVIPGINIGKKRT